MGSWTVSRASIIPTADQEIFTIVPGTAGRVVLAQFAVMSMGVAAGANRIQVSRSTGGTLSGGGSPITPQARHGATGAVPFAVYTAWTTKPTFVSGDPELFSAPGNGGIDERYWEEMDRIMAFDAIGDKISIRCAVTDGVTPLSFSCIVRA